MTFRLSTRRALLLAGTLGTLAIAYPAGAQLRPAPERRAGSERGPQPQPLPPGLAPDRPPDTADAMKLAPMPRRRSRWPPTSCRSTSSRCPRDSRSRSASGIPMRARCGSATRARCSSAPPARQGLCRRRQGRQARGQNIASGLIGRTASRSTKARSTSPSRSLEAREDRGQPRQSAEART